MENAGDSQALIQLKKEYCDKKECLRCRIGYEYLKRQRGKTKKRKEKEGPRKDLGRTEERKGKDRGKTEEEPGKDQGRTREGPGKDRAMKSLGTVVQK